MKHLFKTAAAALTAAVILSVGVLNAVANEVTVSSECDISDIAVPIDSQKVEAAIGGKLDIKATSAILIEPYTGEILYEQNCDEKLPPASITKIMSLLLVMEAIDSGTLSTEDIITASEHACSMGGSQIWLEPGEAMTVDDLLKAAFIASANDATVALGEAVAGSEEGFVDMMNARAAELGMNNTVFKNCTGLDAEGHLTTAHDVAIMSGELIKHEKIKDYTTVWMDTLRDGKSELVNTNKLVRFYQGTTGLKTGTTSGAGYCLSATAEREKLSLVAVIMGGETSNDRFAGAKKLLDYGFANYAFQTVLPEIDENMRISVKKGTEPEVKIKAGEGLCMLLEKKSAAGITKKTVLPESISAPVKKGDKIGSVEVYSNDTLVGEIDVYADETVNKMSIKTAFLRLISALFVP